MSSPSFFSDDLSSVSFASSSSFLSDVSVFFTHFPFIFSQSDQSSSSFFFSASSFLSDPSNWSFFFTHFPSNFFHFDQSLSSSSLSPPLAFSSLFQLDQS